MIYANCSCDCFNCGRSAFCRACDPLLTWSEPDAEGDITAGHYIVTIPTESVPTHRAHFCPVSRATMIKDNCDLDSAKLACERHAQESRQQVSYETTWNPAQRSLLPLIANTRFGPEMDAMQAAIGALARLELLTWSEISRNDDIDLHAGKFSVLPNGARHFLAFCNHEIVGGGETREAAKSDCERYVRKMLGWDP